MESGAKSCDTSSAVVTDSLYPGLAFSAFSLRTADLPWRSQLVRHRSGVREALGSNPGQGMDLHPSRGRGGVVVRLLASHLQANRIRFLAGSLPDFSTWKSCQTMPLVGGFPRVSPIYPAPCIPALLQHHGHEAGFTRDGIFNSHNCLVWAADNSNAVKQARHQQTFSFNVWVGILGDCLTRSHFLPQRLNRETAPVLLSYAARRCAIASTPANVVDA
ncbi:hypothetical protein PR048_010104 [Dryococelus australis]|uniref:Uncharacterized protein n=1 Tax=Dryococelus australis TaxID=614101 RepID=A0ABQ9I1S1_9NEOP|nr:hypothetical protein PR048_010104 [Dryococelus australis]